MAHMESPRFPELIAVGAIGGPGGDSRVVGLPSGHNFANRRRDRPVQIWDVAHGLKDQADLDILYAFFLAVNMREHTFRYKNWLDFAATLSQGRLTRAYQTGPFQLTGVGSGEPDYECGKRYNPGGILFTDVQYWKLVSGTLTVQRNGGNVTAGSGAGQYAVDLNTGVFTFVADASVALTAITPGSSTQFTAATNPLGLAIGEYVYLTGLSGANAGLLNNLRHEITNITGSGPFTFTLITNTNGATITLGTGTAYAYPQSNDVLTAAFEFDLICRFGIDQMKTAITNYRTYDWQQIPVIEEPGPT